MSPGSSVTRDKRSRACWAPVVRMRRPGSTDAWRPAMITFKLSRRATDPVVAGLQRGSRLIGLAAASLDQRLQLRAVEIATHDAHALAVAPVELAALLIENDLLRGVGVSLRDNCLAVLSVDVGPLDGPVVQVWDAHVGPVDMACFNVHDDAVRQMTARHNGRVIRAVRIHQMNATRIQFENEEAWDCDLWGRARDGLLHIAPAFLARQRTGRVSATMTRSPAFGLARNITAGM